MSGRPIALLRLPAVASTAGAPNCSRRIDAIISLTVVLPLLPDDERERQVEARAPAGREAPERRERVVDRDDRTAPAVAIRAHHRGGRALREGAVDEVVAVEALAGERDEEVARRRRGASRS